MVSGIGTLNYQGTYYQDPMLTNFGGQIRTGVRST
jgi:hypothetical protein